MVKKKKPASTRLSAHTRWQHNYNILIMGKRIISIDVRDINILYTLLLYYISHGPDPPNAVTM